MKAILSEHCTGDTGPSRDSIRQRVDVDTLPSLPEDCRPEVGTRPATPEWAGPSPVDRREPSRAVAKGSGGLVESAATTERTFEHLLRSLRGRMVTVVNPESYQEAPVGHRLCPAFDRAKLVGMGKDYIVLVGEFLHRGKASSRGEAKEPIRHVVPIAKINRISLLEEDCLIHI